MKPTKLPRKLILIACASLMVAMMLLALVGFALPSAVHAAALDSTPDGRLNNDAFIPFALYCDSRGVSILQINSHSQGNLILTIDMTAVLNGLHQAATSGANVQIGSSGYISVWALSSAEIEAVLRDPGQVPYEFTFGLDRCSPISFMLVTPVPGTLATSTATPYPTVAYGFLYTVQPGDTLLNISVRFNTSTAALVGVNHLGWNWMIYPGQQLVIPSTNSSGDAVLPQPTPLPYPYSTPPTYALSLPCPSPYLVQTGDTLNIIALRCNRTVAALAIANGIVNPNYIQIGQWLIIPSQ